jgi:plasmid replication initiation protein
MDNKTAQDQKVLQLKKHVAVIHSSNKLTLLQRKIANALLFNAYKELQSKEDHEIHIASLCQLIGYDSNDHKTIKKSLINLLSTVLEWNLVDGDRLDGAAIWNASSIIADASIDGPICTYSYSNKMRKLLHRPHMYGRLDMLVQAKFQSSYGLALYENCSRFQDIGQTPWFDIKKFRQLMGVDDTKYKIFRDFKTRVLDKAVEEVNKHSPIFVNAQLRKYNRQVIAIQFLIKQSQLTLIDAEQNGSNGFNLADKLKSQFGFSKRQLEETFSSYEESYIIEKVSLIEISSSYKTGKIENLAKYLLSALKDDYQPVKKSKISSKDIEKAEQQKRHEQGKRDAHRRQQDKKIIEFFYLRSPDEKNKILIQFEKFLGKSMYWDIYLRSGLEHVLIQDQLCLFVRQQHPNILNEI